MPKWCAFKLDGDPDPDQSTFLQDSLVKDPFSIELNEDDWPTNDT